MQETVSELQTKSFLLRQLRHTLFQLCLLQLQSCDCWECSLSHTWHHPPPTMLRAQFITLTGITHLGKAFWYTKTPYLNVHILAGAEKTFQRLANPKAIALQHAERHAESMWGTIPYRPSKTPLYMARRLLSLPPASTAQSLEHGSLQVLFNFSRIYFSLSKHLQVIYWSGQHFPPTMN